MKYGVRDVVDVVLRAKGTMDIGNKRFYKNEPVLYFDTLTTSTLEGASTTVYAQGGKGNARLMAWEGERTVTFTMEDALISPEGLSILTGAGLIEASDSKPIYQHIVEATDDYTPVTEGEGDAKTVKSLTIKVDKEPFLPDSDNTSVEAENYACVMFTKDGEIVSEPYIVSQAAPATVDADGKYAIVVNEHTCNFGESCHAKNNKGEVNGTGTYYPTDLDVDFKKANGVIVDYYTPIRSGAKQIEIDAETFGGSFYLEGSTLWRDTNGVDHPAEFIIPNCKIQSNFTFTMAATGDPSTFTFTMDAFPGYTRFDKAHKVFAVIQVMEEQTAASDANNDLHRGATWHAADLADLASEGGNAENHESRPVDGSTSL